MSEPEVREPGTCVFCWTSMRNKSGSVMHKECWKRVDNLADSGQLDDEMSEGLDWDLYDTGCSHCNTDECLSSHIVYSYCFRKKGPIQKGTKNEHLCPCTPDS